MYVSDPWYKYKNKNKKYLLWSKDYEKCQDALVAYPVVFNLTFYKILVRDKNGVGGFRKCFFFPFFFFFVWFTIDMAYGTFRIPLTRMNVFFKKILKWFGYLPILDTLWYGKLLNFYTFKTFHKFRIEPSN